MRLLIATRNRHKLQEIRSLVAAPEVTLLDLTSRSDLPDVEEDGDTFVANAIKKAVAMARAARLWALADDSGLEVSSLGGEPGVRSARYAGEPVDYGANNAKLLQALAGHEDRRACFRCVVALADPEGEVRTVEGRCEGRIIESLRGAEGFGYDPLFIPTGYERTFAEMDAETKNRISHRGHALQAAASSWGEMLRAGPGSWREWFQGPGAAALRATPT